MYKFRLLNVEVGKCILISYTIRLNYKAINVGPMFDGWARDRFLSD